jgi:hypothetical protein
MESQWIEHLKKMALSHFPNVDIYELNQCGTGSSDVQIISPVEAVADQAKYQVKRGMKRSRSKASSIKRFHKRKKVQKGAGKARARKGMKSSVVNKKAIKKLKF